MSVLDWVVLALLAVFAWAGWRRGFMSSALSFAGFLAGGLLAVVVLPGVVEDYLDPGAMAAVALIAAVLVCAVLGQAIASWLGHSLRSSISWAPVRFVDSTLGLLLNVLVFAVLTWIVVMAMASVPQSAVTDPVRESKVLITLDRLIPDQARNAVVDMRDAITGTAMPRVFAGLAEVTGPKVPEPDPQSTAAPSIGQVRDAVVRISGAAPECSARLTGSGFVIAPEYVLTNAHVVAGVASPTVQVRRGGPVSEATVVAFDAGLDTAVLHVPGFAVAPLQFAAQRAASGDDAVVAGFPGGEGFELLPARIRTIVVARGEDIYGQTGIEREVYSFRGAVEPGNSGGPLLTPAGRVLGMVFGAGVSDPETGFALTAEQLAATVDQGVGLTEPVATGSCRIRE